MKEIIYAISTFIICFAIGAVGVRTIGIESDLLFTDLDYSTALERQRVSNYSRICDSIAEKQWVTSGRTLSHLRGVDSFHVRSGMANDTLSQMNIATDIRSSIVSECTKLLMVNGSGEPKN